MLAYKFTIATEEGGKKVLQIQFAAVQKNTHFSLHKEEQMAPLQKDVLTFCCQDTLLSFLHEQQMQLKQNSLFW